MSKEKELSDFTRIVAANWIYCNHKGRVFSFLVFSGKR